MLKDHQQSTDCSPSGALLSPICQGKRSSFRHAVLLSLLAALIATSPGCKSGPKFPDKSSKEYADVVSAFYVGLAALQVGDDVHADSRLSEVTRLVPGEPAGWANWGILALRQRNYDAAAQRLEKARDLAPKNDHIYDLLGILESQRGNSAQAIADLRKAVRVESAKSASHLPTRGRDGTPGRRQQRL